MYDILTKTVNKLDGELSTKFVNVAEENADIQEDIPARQTSIIERSDINVSDQGSEQSDEEIEEEVQAASNIVESIAKYDELPRPNEEINHVLISSGYSNIKNK